MTTTEDIILRWMPWLRLNSACDTTRLVLADELEESGCEFAAIRAAFIRKQVMSPDLKELRTIKDTLCTYHRGFVARVEGTFEQLRGGVCPFEFCVDGYWRHSGDGNGPRRTCPHCHGTGRTPGVLASIVRLNPVEWCEVTDKRPWVNAFGRYAGWWEDANHNRASEPAEMLPRELMKRISGSLLRANDTAVSVRWSETNPPGGVIMFDVANAATTELSRVLIEEAIERAALLDSRATA